MITRKEYLKAKKIVAEYETKQLKQGVVSSQLPLRVGNSEKMNEAEKIVRDFISYFKKPPTYKYVSEVLNIAPSAAFARLRNYRHKMIKRNMKIKTDLSQAELLSLQRLSQKGVSIYDIAMRLDCNINDLVKIAETLKIKINR